MIGAVVAGITDSVTVPVFLKRVGVVGAVVFVVFLSVIVRIYSLFSTRHRILVSVGVIGAVIAGITDTVTVPVFLKRVGGVGAVVFVVFLSVIVRIYSLFSTRHRILVSVGVIGAVIAGITDTVTVPVFLKRVGGVGAVVFVVFLSVIVRIYSLFSTCKRTLVSVRVIRAAVAGIADTVTVAVFLVRICYAGAVVFKTFNVVSVRIYCV